MTDIKSLVYSRGRVKASLTNTEKFVADSKSDATFLLDKSNYFKIETRYDKMTNLLEEFEDLQLQIKNIEPEDDEDSSAFESRYFNVYGELKYLMSKFSDNGNVANSVVSSNESANAQLKSFGVKLPEVRLCRFDGTLELFLEFRDLYESMVHRNENLLPIQKFHYLKLSLEGAAADIIKSLAITEDNYNVAWELILKRFNNTKALIFKHLKACFNFDKINKANSKNLRSFIDNISKNLRALQSLNVKTDNWDLLLIHWGCEKLDNGTLARWEEYTLNIDLPTFDKFKLFIEQRILLLQSIEQNTGASESRDNFKGKHSQHRNKSFVSSESESCPICKNDHGIFKCNDFLKLRPFERLNCVRSAKLCTNCLKSGHNSRFCKGNGCKICRLKHNVLLHLKENTNNDNSSSMNDQGRADTGQGTSQPGAFASSATLTVRLNSSVLLSTVVVEVFDKDHQRHRCRLLLDSGSQSNFITYEFFNTLNLSSEKVNFAVTGIGKTPTNLRHKATIRYKALKNQYSDQLSCFLIDNICAHMPASIVNISELNIPKNVVLGDPEFHIPQKIDMLIGAEHFYKLLKVGQIRLGKNLPILQNTCLGWIISGPMPVVNNSFNNSYVGHSSVCDLNETVSKFWELENVQTSCNLSEEDEFCETHFIKTTVRKPDGRFVVSLPFHDLPDKLGASYNNALKRFKRLQVKFSQNAIFSNKYNAFMEEYEKLGHMSRLDINKNPRYILPHHGVVKEESLTTKLRVVFDASAPTSSGASLNDILLSGPNIQSDMLSILIRFRQHKFVVCADMEKMYRQVEVAESERDLQCIIWQPSNSKVPIIYKLNTLTYGTAPAAFLAIRCVRQLAIENQSMYPEASRTISEDLYVDDLVTGCDTVTNTLNLIRDINLILDEGKFTLRKWCSNSKDILDLLNVNETSELKLNFDSTENSKTLGLSWHPKTDKFSYKYSATEISEKVTKRTILSNIAKLFDPLGLLNPFIVRAKIIMQKLWSEKTSWDETVSYNILQEWLSFRDELPLVGSVQVPRLIVCADFNYLELHCFCDASERAYGACVYLRSISSDGNFLVALISAKSRIAPLKTITIPRLELCAALLGAELTKKIVSTLRLEINNIYLWSDSTIALSWINTAPHLLQTFVAHRVAKIIALFEASHWQHVRSELNPADVLSRGSSIHSLKINNSWWTGPPFLQNEKRFISRTVELSDTVPETKSFKVTSVINLIDFGRFSNFSRLLRAFAYILRFINNTRSKGNFKNTGCLTNQELECALLELIKIAQLASFPVEINLLRANAQISESNIRVLNPFLDQTGIIRVGGRLKNADMPFDVKHPILLAGNSHFTKLLINHEHVKNAHLGTQNLLYLLRQQYWITRGKAVVRQVLHKCLRCYRLKAQPVTPFMGDLPMERVTQSLPFSYVGLDYAGPYLIKNSKGRGSKTRKCWISLFICFVTKGVHIEVVSDLTTDCFIAALRRFISRRGRPCQIFSDNATTFVGANNKLKEFYKFFNTIQGEITNFLCNEHITWKFIPPRTPSFGGIWESHIKQIKYHLSRVLTEAKLDFEELYTLCTQIEAILNSRPISPMSSNPNDFLPLTPAHFIAARSLTAVPEPNYGDVPSNRLLRYEYIQKLRHHFWTRWHKEYLTSLQVRPKTSCCSTARGPKIGDLVLLKEDNVPPLCWPLARVHAEHPGADGHTRVVSVKTSNGSVLKRGVNKVCVLPTVSDIN